MFRCGSQREVLTRERFVSSQQIVEMKLCQMKRFFLRQNPEDYPYLGEQHKKKSSQRNSCHETTILAIMANCIFIFMEAHVRRLGLLAF